MKEFHRPNTRRKKKTSFFSTNYTLFRLLKSHCECVKCSLFRTSNMIIELKRFSLFFRGTTSKPFKKSHKQRGKVPGIVKGCGRGLW